MRLNWTIPASNSARGNFLGYAASNRALQAALAARGVTFADDAPTAVAYCYPSLFEPVPRAFNALFTMAETEVLEAAFPIAFAKADLIVTPSAFCRDIFRRYTDKPIEVCPLGYDPSIFRYRKRRAPGADERFRWLACGAPNFRKFSILDDVVRHVLWPLMEDGTAELYIKTTGNDMRAALGHWLSLGYPVQQSGPDLLWLPGLVLDNRYLLPEELAELYATSHGFLALHMGEGFGIPPLEAMATGMPTVVTDYSGTQDFCTRDNSYPVTCFVGQLQTRSTNPLAEPLNIHAARPDLDDATRQIRAVMGNYHRALVVGKRANQSVSRYTWSASAARLVEILRSTMRAAA